MKIVCEENNLRLIRITDEEVNSMNDLQILSVIMEG